MRSRRIELDVRRLTADVDLAELLELTKAFFSEYASCHEDFFEVSDVNLMNVAEYFGRFTEAPDAVAFVATEDGRIRGYITACIQVQSSHWAVRRIGHISGLMVARHARRRGVGTRLLEAVRSFFAESGVRYFTVSTAVSNAAGCGFYKARGLVPLHTNWLGEV